MSKTTSLDRTEVEAIIRDLFESDAFDIEIDSSDITAKIDAIKSDSEKALESIKGEQASALKEGLKQGAEDLFHLVNERLSQAESKLAKAIREASKARPIEVKRVDGSKVKLGMQHYQFDLLLATLSTGTHVYLIGPAGSGKTTGAENCAKALGLKFYFTGAVANEFKLTGFMNAQGEYVSTDFRKAYENGGLFLFDEIDASFPQAVLAFNAALANGYMDFPDKQVERHPDFVCIAAANTFGTGANREYVGRNQLDAASLDRFAFIEWGFDEKLERFIAGNDTWVSYVQDVRKTLERLKIRHLVSPRASMFGAKMLKAGISLDQVVDSLIFKGMPKDTRDKVEANLKNV